MSQQNKDMLKHALISLLVGAVIAFIQALLTGLLSLLNDGNFNIAGPLAGMIYYTKGRKITV
jgi:hypothetical protein